LGGSYFAANGDQRAGAILNQAFVRLKNLGTDKSSSLRIGRFEFADGAETTPADPTLATLKRDHIAHRLIGNFGFSHIGRSFDGVHFARSTGSSNFTFVAARPTEGVFQLRGWNELDVDFYYAAFTKPINTGKASGEARLFALHYHDGRRVAKVDNRSADARQADTDNIRLTTIGGHHVNAIKAGAGALDILLWGAGQFGSWGQLDHRAAVAAIAAEVGYQFKTSWRPWVRGGYFRSSGDGDRSDGNHSTFFQALPTPRIYARFPFYNLMNIEDLFAQLRLRPVSGLSLRTDVRRLRLSSRDDLWYVGGGAFQDETFGFTGRPSGGARNLGVLVDLSADYNMTKKTGLTFYTGFVRGGNLQAGVYPQAGARPKARFSYLELTRRF
jgi:hypothetical protein